jgi:hypothetical protein
MESTGKEDTVDKSHPELARSSTGQVNKVRKLFAEWLQDRSGYDEEAWPQLKVALNENHSKSHKLFNE